MSEHYWHTHPPDLAWSKVVGDYTGETVVVETFAIANIPKTVLELYFGLYESPTVALERWENEGGYCAPAPD